MQEISQEKENKNQLILNNLVIGYEKPLLEPVSKEFGPGIHIISGTSGSGKSTLLKTLSALQKEIEGTYTPLKSIMCFQEPVLLDKVSVIKNLQYTKAGREKIEELTEVFDLRALYDQRADQISAGQRQRLALAMALLKEPQLLLLDEALAFQDPKRKENLISFLQKKIEQDEIICLWVTHSTLEKELLKGKNYSIEQGRFTEENGSF